MSKPTERQIADLMDLQAMSEEPLLPELQAYVEEDGPLGGPMLRHPLIYDMFVSAMPGQTNRAYEYKRKAIAEAKAEEDWHTVVFLHERPYRLKALIDYVTGTDDGGSPLPLACCDVLDNYADICALVADVWVDSENIGQNEEEWRAVLLEPGDRTDNLWLGTDEERAAFDALPDPIPAWRGGIVGDWSWTTDKRIAEFFSNRSKYPVREALIPKADCFGYFTRRNESELLVRLTPERAPLVYPDRFQKP